MSRGPVRLGPVQRRALSVVQRCAGARLDWVPARWVHKNTGICDRLAELGYAETRRDHNGRVWVRPRWYQPELPR